MQHFIVIGSLCFIAIWLCRDVQGESSIVRFLKSLVSFALGICMFIYYSAYMVQAPEYKLTCDRCGVVFVSEDHNARRICADCTSAFLDEQFDTYVEEQFPDGYETELFRISTCSKCGKKYMEPKRSNTPEDDPKRCEDCSFTDKDLAELAQQGGQGFLDRY